jgi:cell division transport system permease protein
MARNATPRAPAPKPARKRNPGARSARTSFSDRFEAWRRHHRDSARDAFQRMVATPAASIMTVLVIAIALALPAGLAVMLDNVRALTRGWDGNAHLSVFLDKKVGESEQRSLAAAWQDWSDIRDTEVVTPEQALEEYKALSGFGNVLDSLPDNPLPPLVIVYPADASPQALERLQSRLAEQAGVARAQLDIQWVRRLHAMLGVAERLVSALALALALAVVLVVVNTIRLAIESRREEITVIKTVGGTDGFVRRPFLYTGFWFGLAGGVVAVLLVQAALWWLGSPVEQLTGLYDSDYSLTGLGASAFIFLPFFAGTLGLMGAWVAVGRHLRALEPRGF